MSADGVAHRRGRRVMLIPPAIGRVTTEADFLDAAADDARSQEAGRPPASAYATTIQTAVKRSAKTST